MKMLSRVVLSAAFGCCFAAVSQAQTAGGAEPWSFGVGVNGSYEGNALFAASEGEEEFSHAVSASLGRAWALRRGSANLTGNASQFFYRKSTSLNDFRFNASGGLSHALTRRLLWSGTSQVSSGLARDSAVLIDAGLVLPSVSTRSSSSSSMFTYALSRQSQLTWSLSQSGVGFSSGAFQGGSALTSALSWSRQVGRSHTVGVTQDYSRTFQEDASTTIHGVSGTWSGTMGSWTAYGSLGVRPYSVPGEEGHRLTTGISAGVTKPVRPGQSVGMSYDRSVTQTFGIDTGNHLVQSVSGNYSVALTRSLTTSFTGNYSRSRSPVDPERGLEGQTGSASLAYQLMPSLAVSVSSAVYSRMVRGAERATSYNTSVALTYGMTWR
jgi:hypothetical protein